MDYEVTESYTWKQGIFGEKKVPVYGYIASFTSCITGFYKAVSFCCDYVFKSEYLKMFKSNMLKSLEKEVNEKVLNKLTTA